MWKKGIYFLGGIVAAPFIKPILRPVAREAVRAGMAVGGYLNRLAEEAKEEVDDLRAEARSTSGRGRKAEPK